MSSQHFASVRRRYPNATCVVVDNIDGFPLYAIVDGMTRLSQPSNSQEHCWLNAWATMQLTGADKPLKSRSLENSAEHRSDSAMASPKKTPEHATHAVEPTPAPAGRLKFEIEDNVPLPTKRIGVKGDSIYPFDDLKVNASFFVPVTDASKEPWKTLTSMASRKTRELHPRKFVTARVVHNGKDGVRIWRVEDTTKPLAPPRVRKKSGDGVTAEALAKEAADGDTSKHHAAKEPMFEEAA